MANDKKKYEVLERLSFGNARQIKDGRKVLAEKQPENTGTIEPTPEGQDNPTVSLSDQEAQPLLDAGTIKPAGQEAVPTNHDNPEELGYAGEEARDEAMKSDEAYTSPPEPPKRGRPKKSSESS